MRTLRRILAFARVFPRLSRAEQDAMWRNIEPRLFPKRPSKRAWTICAETPADAVEPLLMWVGGKPHGE